MLSDSFSMVELPVPEAWTGHNLEELDLRKKYSINVIAVKDGEDIRVTVNPKTLLRAEEVLILIGENKELAKLMKTGNEGTIHDYKQQQCTGKKHYCAEQKAKERREQDVFVAEGWKMFQEAPREWLKKVYVSESGSKMHEIPSDGTEYEVVDDRVFQSMCDTKTPQGVLSVIRMPHYTEEEVMDNGKTPLLMVLEDLQDPGNVGTIIRTAEGAGVTGIIMSRGTADIFNPKTIRSTMGSIYRMPFLIVDDAVGFVKGLKARKICTYAAHLHGVHSYREEDYTKGTAFLIGNEGNGLTDAMAEAAECLIRIPMEGKVESLNAAIASAVLMYEAHGQRA